MWTKAIIWSLFTIAAVSSRALSSNDEVEKESPTCTQVFDKFDKPSQLLRLPKVEFKLWPNGTIPYDLAEDLIPSEKELITSIMKVLESVTCVKWVPRKQEEAFVSIQTGDSGCYSHVGYSPMRVKHVLHLQTSNDLSTCMVPGIIAHEMLHVLGFIHEHTRPDRDDYIDVHWENINPANAPEFFRALTANVTEESSICDGTEEKEAFKKCFLGYLAPPTLGIPYDYDSVMHYGEYEFSMNNKKTLSPKMIKDAPNKSIGQRQGLSMGDLLKINLAYSCPKATLKNSPIPYIPANNSFNKNIVHNLYSEGEKDDALFLKLLGKTFLD